jgi:hypothetical protein
LSGLSTATSTFAAGDIVLALSEQKFGDASGAQQAKKHPKTPKASPQTPSLERQWNAQSHLCKSPISNGLHFLDR